MSNRIRLRGTTEKIFCIGLANNNQLALNTEALTLNNVWRVPDNAVGFLKNDGDGNLTWEPAGGGSGDGMMPFFIQPTETYHIPQYKQGLYTLPIDNEGAFIIDGILVEVT